MPKFYGTQNDNGLPDDINGIDTYDDREKPAAGHILAEKGKAAFIDAGTMSAPDYLLSSLNEKILTRQVGKLFRVTG